MIVEKSNNYLIAVQGPLQFITAFIAFKWYVKNNVSTETIEATLLIYDTFVPQENEEFFFETIKSLSKIYNWEKIVHIDSKTMHDLSLVNYKSGIKKFKETLKSNEFDSIFIAGDFGNFGTSLLLDCFSNSHKIEYGDSFGLVGYEMEGKNFSFKRFQTNPIKFIKALGKKIIFQQFHKKHNLQHLILTIPLDWTGNYLSGKCWEIPDAAFANTILINLVKQLPSLQHYCAELVGNQKPYLFLLSNFYNSGYCSFENELSLYFDIIKEKAVFGSTVILKNHPRGSRKMIDELTKLLKDIFVIKNIDDPRFKYLPIELWTTLLSESKVYPIFSSSVISIKYFLSTDINMVLNNTLISKYIHPSMVEETIKSEDMNRLVFNKLDRWDQKAVLWSGKLQSNT